MSAYPTSISRAENNRLLIEWSDGQRRRYAPRDLRDACPSGSDDDADPGDLGTNGGIGDFVQPSLDLLANELIMAHVRTVTLEPADDARDDAPFIRNLTNVNYGETVRDTPTSSDFWIIQVFAAYEWNDTSDGDGEGRFVGGNTAGQGIGPINVYLETLRDASATPSTPPVVDAERLRQRTVLHEAIHRFGVPHGPNDVRVMDYKLFWKGSDEQISLNGDLRRKIEENDPR